MLKKLMAWAVGKNASTGAMDSASVDAQSGDGFDEIRSVSKRQIELFEHWSRRLIDEHLKAGYGPDYLNAQKPNGEFLVKSEVRNLVQSRKQGDPGRFPRDIDAILLEDIKYFLTKEELYNAYFKPIVESFYSGREEIRRIMDRLIPIRNKLYHDNHISIREAEQVLCYTNDFIDVLKEHYQLQGREREFNVPTFLSLSDSQGNRVFRKQPSYSWEVQNTEVDRLADYRKHGFLDAICTSHRSGEHYEIEFEVDESFLPNTYTVAWMLALNHTTVQRGEGTRITVNFTDEMVSYEPILYVELTTNRSWHRFASIGCDDKVEVRLSKVLPPIEDSY